MTVEAAGGACMPSQGITLLCSVSEWLHSHEGGSALVCCSETSEKVGGVHVQSQLFTLEYDRCGCAFPASSDRVPLKMHMGKLPS